MRKFYFTLAISILVQTTIFSQIAPISFDLPTTKFCSGQIFPISFTNDPFLNGHTFQVQLSNSSGSFASGISVLGSGTSSPISCTMISAITYNESSYKIQIVDITSIINFSAESNTIIINDLGSHLFISTDSLLNSSANTTVCNGSTLKLFPLLVYFDDYAISYQWINSLNPNPSTVISNQNKISVSESGSYSYNVSKPGCTGGTSYPISISFSSTINSFLTFPGNIHCNGVSVPLTPSYVSQTSTYEWKKDNVIIPNTINRRYNATTTGNYSVKITDKACQISNNSTLSFGNNTPCQILAFSDTIEICNASISYLNAIATKLEGNTLEWFKDGRSITNPNQFLQAIPISTGGTYTVKLKEGNCTVMSNPVVLKTVTSFKPTFTISTETTICASTTNLKTIFEPGITKSYQWQRNGINLAGATSYFYYTGSTSEPYGGLHTLQVTQGNCTGISNPVNISIVENNPTYRIIASNKVCTSSQRLSILPSNSNDTFWQNEFQWFKDGIAIESAIGYFHDAEVSGVYRIRITKSNCVGFSQDLSVVIGNSLGKPIISTLKEYTGTGGAKYTQCKGNVVQIYAKDPNYDYTNFQWKKDGVNIPNPSGVTNYFYASQSGNYSLQYTSGTCTVESNPIKINIGDKQQSIKTNNWNDTSSWACGTVPTITDEVLINKGHTISLPDNYTGFLKNLDLNGSLQKGNNAQLKFQTN